MLLNCNYKVFCNRDQRLLWFLQTLYNESYCFYNWSFSFCYFPKQKNLLTDRKKYAASSLTLNSRFNFNSVFNERYLEIHVNLYTILFCWNKTKSSTKPHICFTFFSWLIQIQKIIEYVNKTLLIYSKNQLTNIA